MRYLLAVLITATAFGQVTTITNTTFPNVRTAINNNFSWLNTNKAGNYACGAGKFAIKTMASPDATMCADAIVPGANAALASLAITSGSDGTVLAVRRYSAGQTNNPFEVQTEANAFLGGFTALGRLKYDSVTDGCATWSGNVLGSTGSACGAGGSLTTMVEGANSATTTAINFIAGTNVSLARAFNTGQLDLTINATGSGTGDVSSNTATSVDGEMVLFNSTTGKSIKRSALTGVLKSSSGVAAVVTGNASDFVKVDGSSGPVTTTRQLSVLNWSCNPDNSGNVWWEPWPIKATNDAFKHGAWVFSNTGTPELHCTFTIPANYTASPVIRLVWTSATTGSNVGWEYSYRVVGGDDTTSLDQATAMETVTMADNGPTAANSRLSVSQAFTTSANVVAGSTMQLILRRNGGTLAAASLLMDALFEYTGN